MSPIVTRSVASLYGCKPNLKNDMFSKCLSYVRSLKHLKKTEINTRKVVSLNERPSKTRKTTVEVNCKEISIM